MRDLETVIEESLADGRETEWIERLVRDHAVAFDAMLRDMGTLFEAEELKEKRENRYHSLYKLSLRGACHKAVAMVMRQSGEMAGHIRQILAELILHLPAPDSEYGFSSIENLTETVLYPMLMRAAQTGLTAGWMSKSFDTDGISLRTKTGTGVLFRIFGQVPDADDFPWWYYSLGIGDVLADSLTIPASRRGWTARCGEAKWRAAGKELHKLGILPGPSWGHRLPPVDEKGEPELPKVTAKLLWDILGMADDRQLDREIANLLELDLEGAAAQAKVEWLRLALIERSVMTRHGSRETSPVKGLGEEPFTVAHTLAVLGHAPTALVPDLDTPAAGFFKLTIKLCGIVGGAFQPKIENIAALLEGTDTDHCLLRYALQTDPESPGLPVVFSTKTGKKTRSLDFDEWRGIGNLPLFRQLLDRPDILKCPMPIHPLCRLTTEPAAHVSVGEMVLLNMVLDPDVERQRTLVREVLCHPECWAIPVRIPRTNVGWKKGYRSADCWDNGTMPFPIAVLATIELNRGAKEKIWEQGGTRAEDLLMAGLSTGDPMEIVQGITSHCTQGRTNLRNLGLNSDALKAAAKQVRARQALQHSPETDSDDWAGPCL
jgi:hypothetical protein